MSNDGTIMWYIDHKLEHQFWRVSVLVDINIQQQTHARLHKTPQYKFSVIPWQILSIISIFFDQIDIYCSQIWPHQYAENGHIIWDKFIAHLTNNDVI